MAVATDRLTNTPIGKNQACFSSGDNQPATKGDSGIAMARMSSQVLVALSKHREAQCDTRACDSGQSSRHHGVAFGESQRHEVSLITVTSEQGRHRSAATASSDSVYGLISRSIMSFPLHVPGIDGVSVKI